jgi:hypothetical protein
MTSDKTGENAKYNFSWPLLRLQQLRDLHSSTRTKKPIEISRKEQLLKWLKSEKIIFIKEERLGKGELGTDL